MTPEMKRMMELVDNALEEVEAKSANEKNLDEVFEKTMAKHKELQKKKGVNRNGK